MLNVFLIWRGKGGRQGVEQNNNKGELRTMIRQRENGKFWKQECMSLNFRNEKKVLDVVYLAW